MIPLRNTDSLEKLKTVFSNFEDLLIDGTERPYFRSKNPEIQEEIYSVKKNPTLKDTVISIPERNIFYLGETFPGKTHDYSMLKQELPPGSDIFQKNKVAVDLAYLGIDQDYYAELL